MSSIPNGQISKKRWMPILIMTRTYSGARLSCSPCDDPEWSNFTKYFALRFTSLGIKKLISTSYTPQSSMGVVYSPKLSDDSTRGGDKEQGKNPHPGK